MKMKTHIHQTTFTQDEAIVIRTLIDCFGTALNEALIVDPDIDPKERADLNFALDRLGSISKKLADSLSYLGDY